MKCNAWLWGLCLASLVAQSVSVTRASDLTFEDRVKAQTAIEEVYWSHRLWPKENPGSKPALADVVSRSALSAKVENSLRESNALAEIWHRPITPAQLQAELDRMAAQTRAPEVLRQIIEALGNDPQVIAETLARPALADRLIREWYALDDHTRGVLTRGDHTSFDAWWSSVRLAHAPIITTLPAARYTLPTPSLTACLNDTWKALPRPPSARNSHVAVWTGTEMIVWGGFYATTRAELYNPATDTWAQATIEPGTFPPEVTGMTAVWTGTEMIVWGGGYSYQPFQSGTRYNPVTDVAIPTAIQANTPQARKRHTAVWTGTEMIVWGGDNDSGNGNVTYFGDGGRYNPSTNSWKSVPYFGAPAPSPRSRHTAVWTGSLMLVWGGSNGSAYLDNGARYDINASQSGEWTPLSLVGAPSGRMGHSTIWTGTQMIVWGGTDGTVMQSGARYSPSSNTWTPTAAGAGAPSARAQHSAIWTGSRMIVWGGESSSELSYGGALYDPVSDTWTPTATGAGAPEPRALHTAVWTGNEMIVYGGYPSYQVLNTGGRYDPASNTWIPTSRSTGYPPDYMSGGVTPIFTGSEMIVWGSLLDPAPTNFGGRFNVVTGAWLPVSRGAGAPARRSGHSAVWTGREMIVWGGIGSSQFRDGGRYDPITDLWSAVAIDPNTPSARYWHNAVWTGSEMIVWGATSPQSGARYRPASDRWVPMAAAPPDLFDDYWATWTGDEMLLWGTENGARYSPGTDTWTTVSTVNGPGSRIGASKVWTGSQMIVWGGNSQGDYLDTGARYDLPTDSWSPTSTGTNVPQARSGHAAAWTGDEMIVWGGGSTSVPIIGGRYRPSTDSWTPMGISFVPPELTGNKVAWTGQQMILWSGFGGAIYCACPNGRLVYRDADGDGFGVMGVPTPSCDGSIPAGHVVNDVDCGDTSPSVLPGGTETCNGLDDDCDGVADEGGSSLCNDLDPCTTDVCGSDACAFTPIVVPEVNDSLAVTKSGPSPATAVVSWFDGAGPFNVYRGAKSAPAWTYDTSCLAHGTSGPAEDELAPGPGVTAWYLVSRTSACGESVVGHASDGSPIPNASPCP